MPKLLKLAAGVTLLFFTLATPVNAAPTLGIPRSFTVRPPFVRVACFKSQPCYMQLPRPRQISKPSARHAYANKFRGQKWTTFPAIAISRSFGQGIWLKRPGSIGLVGSPTLPQRPKIENFPVIFPVSREFKLETGPIQTASSASQCGHQRFSR
jgi:hypothetical protein